MLYGGSFDDGSEERVDLWAINIAYMSKPFEIERLNVFLGRGIGRLGVDKQGPDSEVKGPRCPLYNLGGGINVRAFWAIGFYVVGRYYYAQEETDVIEPIDFREWGFLFGFSVNFGI